MKKIILISLAVFVIFGVTGCDWRKEVVETENSVIYNDPEEMFSFQYPEKFLGEEYLRVENRKVEDLNFSLGHNKEAVEKDIESLKQGNYGESIDFVVKESESVVKIDELNGKNFMVLGRFDVCDVVFERKLVFYTGDRQIMITLNGPEEEIMESMSDYFSKNNSNCEDMTVWKFKDNTKNDFYNVLKNGEGSEVAQNWYDSFDKIIQTIEVNTEKEIE